MNCGLPLLVTLSLGLAACEPSAPAPPAAPLGDVPGSRPGGPPLGTPLRARLPRAWPLDERPTLVRFFTDSCPYCAASLPALEDLRARTPELAVLAVYHPKPAREVTLEDARAHARALGFEGPVAVDGHWATLRELAPLAGASAPTSISILLDRQGRARWFHPGPELFPSDVPADGLAAADFADLERAVQVVSAETDE